MINGRNYGSCKEEVYFEKFRIILFCGSRQRCHDSYCAQTCCNPTGIDSLFVKFSE